MPIFFKPSASDFSLSADSIGNRWLQEPVVRPNGFPLYHWIQTERGEGLLTLEGQKLLLKPGDGVLIAPHVPHEYRENDGSGMWFTSFLTFDGKLSDDLYKICAVSPYLFVPASTVNEQRIYGLCKGYLRIPTKSQPMTNINKRPKRSERKTCISVCSKSLLNSID